MYNPKSKRTSKQIGAVKKKTLDGLTANKNIDDIRALSKISNVQTQEIKNVSSELSSVSSSVSSKQNKLKLTTTGSSGPATLSNDILNVPDYSLGMGITIGTTAIASGTVGRVLFEGAGNVVQESANFFWDNTNGRLGIGTSSPSFNLDVVGTSRLQSSVASMATFTTTASSGRVIINNTTATPNIGIGLSSNSVLKWSLASYGATSDFTFFNDALGLDALFIKGSTNNVLIGTTTDAGFKLDVNGSTRVSGTLWTDNISPVGSTLYIYSVGASGVGGYNRLNISYSSTNGFVMQSDGGAGGSRNMSIFGGGPGGSLNLGTNGTSRWTLLSSYDALGPGHLVPVGSNTYDIGTPTNTVRYLYSNLGRFSGSLNAATNLAQGVSISNTLVATANNDVLIGLDIAPTFTNGAFTGVSNWAMRLYNSIRFETPSDLSQGIFWKPANDGTTLRIYGSTFSAGIGFLQLNVQSGSDGLSVNGGARTLSINAAQSSISLNLNNILFNTHGTGEAARIVVSTKNFLIGTTTDAGYKLDVNGTARVVATHQIYRNNQIGAINLNLYNGQSGWQGGVYYNTEAGGAGQRLTFYSGGALGSSDGLTIFSNRNVLIQNGGTHTDAGFRLDVNGSARVQSGLTVSGSLNLNSSDISSAWIAYTPTWSTDGATQPSLGNGTITGAYKVIGKTVFVRVRLVFGTTTTAGTGTFYFSLPVNAAAAWGIQMPASILDNGNAWYQATVNGEYGGLTDRVALIGQSAGGANSSQGVTGVFPIGFGNTDSIQFNGSYETL